MIRSSPWARNVWLRARSRLVCRRRTAFRRGLCVDSIWFMSQKKRRPFQERRPGGCLSVCRVPGGPGSGSRRLAGDLGETSEGVCVAHGDVGEHLAVELDAGQLEAVHQLRVAHAVDPRGGVDAGDPQAPEIALAVAPVAVGVGVCLEQGLLGALVVGVRLAAEALRLLKYGTALLAGADGALDACHLPTPSIRLIRGVSSSETIIARPRSRLCLGDFFSRMWLVKACRPRTLPVAVTLKRFFAPECVFILGIASPIMTRCCRLPRFRPSRRAQRRPPRLLR